jgi:hypothetical protein
MIAICNEEKIQAGAETGGRKVPALPVSQLMENKHRIECIVNTKERAQKSL